MNRDVKGIYHYPGRSLPVLTIRQAGDGSGFPARIVAIVP